MESQEQKVYRLESLADVYQMKLRQAQNFESQWRSQTTLALRDMFRTRAHRLEKESGDIAHCIARFGNLSLAEAHFEALRSDLDSIAPSGFNPWQRGLSILSQLASYESHAT